MSNLSKLMLVPWAIAFIALLTLLVQSRPQPPLGDERRMFHVQVLKAWDDYHYCMRDEYGTVFTAHYCEDYQPQFDAGMTLDVLTISDYGWCWSVKNTHPAYLIHRIHGKIVRETFDDRPCEGSQTATNTTQSPAQ